MVYHNTYTQRSTLIITIKVYFEDSNILLVYSIGTLITGVM